MKRRRNVWNKWKNWKKKFRNINLQVWKKVSLSAFLTIFSCKRNIEGKGKASKTKRRNWADEKSKWWELTYWSSLFSIYIFKAYQNDKYYMTANYDLFYLLTWSLACRQLCPYNNMLLEILNTSIQNDYDTL